MSPAPERRREEALVLGPWVCVQPAHGRLLLCKLQGQRDRSGGGSQTQHLAYQALNVPNPCNS